MNDDVMIYFPKTYRKIEPTETGGWLTTISLEPLIEEGIIEVQEHFITAYKPEERKQ